MFDNSDKVQDNNPYTRDLIDTKRDLLCALLKDTHISKYDKEGNNEFKKYTRIVFVGYKSTGPLAINFGYTFANCFLDTIMDNIAVYTFSSTDEDLIIRTSSRVRDDTPSSSIYSRTLNLYMKGDWSSEKYIERFKQQKIGFVVIIDSDKMIVPPEVEYPEDIIEETKNIIETAKDPSSVELSDFVPSKYKEIYHYSEEFRSTFLSSVSVEIANKMNIVDSIEHLKPIIEDALKPFLGPITIGISAVKILRSLYLYFSALKFKKLQLYELNSLESYIYLIHSSSMFLGSQLSDTYIIEQFPSKKTTTYLDNFTFSRGGNAKRSKRIVNKKHISKKRKQSVHKKTKKHL